MALPDLPSVAVIPFTNMSGDAGQDYFADGMAEEIITALSRCGWLFVIARNSSFTYKGKAVDVRQIGRELGVRYVLEGSVRRAGNRVRITGQLVDATSGMHIWADRFDGDTSEVFDLQDRITESVVAAIEPKLQAAEIARLKHKPEPNLDAYDLLLRAQSLEYEFTEESLTAAIRCLKQALANNPTYAQAMAQAANCYSELHIQGWTRTPEADAAEGLRMAVRAELAGTTPTSYGWLLPPECWGSAPGRGACQTLLAVEPQLGHRVDASGLDRTASGESDKGAGIAWPGGTTEPSRPEGMVHGGGRRYGSFHGRTIRRGYFLCEESLGPKSSFFSNFARSSSQPRQTRACG
jgi:TolB-like protein